MTKPKEDGLKPTDDEKVELSDEDLDDVDGGLIMTDMDHNYLVELSDTDLEGVSGGESHYREVGGDGEIGEWENLNDDFK